MQEIVNIAENAMGIEASVATGPSTSLVPASSVALDAFGGPGTDVVPASTANTGIATLDPSGTDVGGLVGEIITDTDVGAATAQADPVFDTIDGTTNSMEVDVAQTVAADPFVYDGVVIDPKTVVDPKTVIDPNTVIDAKTVVDPKTVVVATDPITTNPITTTEVVPQTQLVPSTFDDDDDDIIVEVDEVEDDDDIIVDDNDDDPEDVVVDLDTDDDDVDDEVVEEAPFECPEGFEAKKINGQWRCQAEEEEGAQRVRPTGGAYYQPNLNPEYGSRRRA
tara:strand:- start:420 stop:1256 length:837 start_codon:yes stop_codon:yes gene_type:complete